jgi:hypothetical protein
MLSLKLVTVYCPLSPNDRYTQRQGCAAPVDPE